MAIATTAEGGTSLRLYTQLCGEARTSFPEEFQEAGPARQIASMFST